MRIGLWIAALAGALGLHGPAAAETPSPEQTQLLGVLERAAQHILSEGDHMPVTAFVMRPSGDIELIDLEGGFANQEEALTATLGRLMPMADAKQIKASGIVFQPGDAGEEKPPVLIFDIEQVGQPRFIVTLTYGREGERVLFGSKTYKSMPARLLAQ